MASDEVAALDERLQGFLEPMLGFLGREDRRRWARTYVAGLLLEGERKSIQPLAARLGLGGRRHPEPAAVCFHRPLGQRHPAGGHGPHGGEPLAAAAR